MSEIKLKIDYDYFDTYSSYEELKQLSSILFISNEKEFNILKEQKCFKVVYDSIIMCNTPNTRITPYIKTILQAQELFIEILFRLSEYNLSFNSLLLNYYSQIEILAKNNINIYQQVSKSKNRSLSGLGKEYTINNLNERERIILKSIIYNLQSELDDIPSDNQLEYSRILFNKLEVDSVEVVIGSPIEFLKNVDSKKVILNCCMEYLFLFNNNLSYLDNFNLFYEKFDFGIKTLTAIKDNIQETYEILGYSGLIDKYKELNIIDEYSFTFDIDYKEAIENLQDISEENVQENQEFSELDREKLVVDEKINIHKNEQKTIANKDINVIETIDCQGSLTFENCYIYYNQEKITKQIVVSKGAKLIFNNCTIISCNKEKHYFIDAKKGSDVEFYNSVIYDCAYFIKSDVCSNLLLIDCKINNPSEYFINGVTENGEILGCEINFTDKIHKLFPAARENTTIFDLKEDNKNHYFSIKNTTVIGGDEYIEGYEESIIFRILNGVYENCLFKKINSRSIVGYQIINNCTFISCVYPIFASQQNNNFPAIIVNSIFDSCLGAIQIKEWELLFNNKYILSNCKFHNCLGSILETDRIKRTTSIDISCCEFQGCNLDKEIKSLICVDLDTSNFKMLIHKCIFEDIYLKSAFLLETKIHKNYNYQPIKVSRCTFKECNTNNFKGLIKEYSENGSNNDLKKIKMILIENCTGLDNKI